MLSICLPSKWISPQSGTSSVPSRCSKRRLAAAALADDRQELALPHGQADAAEHGHFHRPLAVGLVQALGQQDCGGGIRREGTKAAGADEVATVLIVRNPSERQTLSVRGRNCNRLLIAQVPPRDAAGRRGGPATRLPARRCPTPRRRSRRPSPDRRSSGSCRDSRFPG